MILIVAALSFLVLLLGFRSPLLAAEAAVMNLVSVAAAYGVLRRKARATASARSADADQ